MIHIKNIGILVLILLNIPKLNACSCDTTSLINAIEHSDEIFIGKVVKIEKTERSKFIGTNNREIIDWNYKYHFEVEKNWKGDKNSELILHSGGGSCSFWFDLGKMYLVYASRTPEAEPQPERKDSSNIIITSYSEPNTLGAWSCSRTTQKKTWIWERGNWYKSDLERLDKELPDYHVFREKGINKFWWIIGGILVFTISFSLIRKR